MIAVYNKITIIVLPTGYYSYKLLFTFAYSDFKCNFNHKGYYTVTTIRVNHIFNHGNIIRLFSSVNSSVSDYKEH